MERLKEQLRSMCRGMYVTLDVAIVMCQNVCAMDTSRQGILTILLNIGRGIPTRTDWGNALITVIVAARL